MTEHTLTAKLEGNVARYYTDEAIEKLKDESAGLKMRCFCLQQRCMGYKFGNEQAKEIAWYGFSRRLSSLVRCIKNIFGTIPPELEDIPTFDATQDAAIQVQAFIFNLLGCLDNLAWVWVLERNITKPDGAPIPPEWIGLRPKNIAVRASLSEELHNCLKSMAEWFKYLEDYRPSSSNTFVYSTICYRPA